MQGKLFVFVVIVALASATQIQNLNGTLQGQWSNTCRSYLSVERGVSNLTVIQGEGKDSNITLIGASYLNNTNITCAVEALNATKFFVSEFEDYNDVASSIGSKQGQFVRLNCTVQEGEPDVFSDVSSSSDDDTSLEGDVASVNITVLNLAQGVLLNFPEEPDCSAFFTVGDVFNLTEVSLVNGKAEECNCTTICFNGTTTFTNITIDDETQTGSISIAVTNVTGSYVFYSDSDTNATYTNVTDQTIECIVSFIPEYPSSVIAVEDCVVNGTNDTKIPVIESTFSLTFLDEGSVIVIDQADDSCVSVVLGQAIMIASLFLALFTAFVNFF